MANVKKKALQTVVEWFQVIIAACIGVGNNLEIHHG
jgi:hypothetical protein